MKVFPWIFAMFVLGFGSGYAWRGLPFYSVTAEGELQYEKPQPPEVTPSYPPGYFVQSRVYLAGAAPDMLGKRVMAYGTSGTLAHPETSAYPMIHGSKIAVVKANATP